MIIITGFLFWVWMKLGKSMGSLMKKLVIFVTIFCDISTWWRRWECCCPRCPSSPPQCRTSLQTREGPWGDMCGFWARIFSVISIPMFLGTWQCRRTRSPPQQSRIWRRSEFACQPADIHQRPQQRGFQTNIPYYHAFSSHLAEDSCFAVFGYVMSNLDKRCYKKQSSLHWKIQKSYFKVAESSCAFCMDHPLGNSLPDKKICDQNIEKT